MIDSPYRTTKEAAEYLRISPKALLKHVVRGRIVPDHLAGANGCKTHLFRVETLERFLGREGGKAA